MIRWRSLSPSDIQRAISSSVRPQPRQSCERGSMVQTLVQGEAIAIVCLVAIRRKDKDQGPQWKLARRTMPDTLPPHPGWVVARLGRRGGLFQRAERRHYALRLECDDHFSAEPQL